MNFGDQHGSGSCADSPRRVWIHHLSWHPDARRLHGAYRPFCRHGPDDRRTMETRLVIDLFENIRLSLADPQTRHAILVHFPIAFSVLAIPFTLVLPFMHRRRALAYRLLLAAAIFATGVIAWQAGEAGEAAENMARTNLGETGISLLEDHHQDGERVPLLLTAIAAMVLVSVVPRPMVRSGAGILAFGLTLATVLWTASVADQGGRLVYWFGAAGVGQAETTSASD